MYLLFFFLWALDTTAKNIITHKIYSYVFFYELNNFQFQSLHLGPGSILSSFVEQNLKYESNFIHTHVGSQLTQHHFLLATVFVDFCFCTLVKKVIGHKWKGPFLDPQFCFCTFIWLSSCQDLIKLVTDWVMSFKWGQNPQILGFRHNTGPCQLAG